MEFNELKELVELFSKSNIDQLDLDQEGLTLKLAKKKEKLVAAPVAAAAPATAVAVATEAVPAPAANAASDEDASLVHVTSPIVGTFYRAPNPNADVFVKIGDTVHKGQTMCIVEAMKLMNEIQADNDGVVAKILVENGQGVEFGQPLFALKPH